MLRNLYALTTMLDSVPLARQAASNLAERLPHQRPPPHA